MSMKIEVYIPEAVVEAGDAPDYLARCMTAIGYGRGVSLPMPAAAPVQGLAEALKQSADQAKALEVEQTEEAPKRERGKPSAGRARRTKEEIAEDEAADALDAASATVEEATNTQPEDKPLISSGEERVDPAEAAQDADDERAQAEATKAAEGKAYTRDDVRNAMVEFVNTHGSGEMSEDMIKTLSQLYPDGSVTKLSEIPDNSDDFLAVINGLSNASKAREAMK